MDDFRSFIGARIDNCFYNAFFWESPEHKRDFRITKDQFMHVMRNNTDKQLMKIPNFGGVSVDRCRFIYLCLNGDLPNEDCGYE